MAKKKKRQLKPVARGFAITSVPKKPAQTEDETLQNETSKAESDAVVIADPPRLDEFDDKVEEQALQNLVDTLQEKTEKEITRNIKVIEQERSLSKTFPHLELDPVFVNEIITLSQNDNTAEGKNTLDEPEDKALAKVGITYGTLRRLGFSAARVEECLRSIGGVDLEEAYHWLYTHCHEEELEGANEEHMPKPLASIGSQILYSQYQDTRSLMPQTHTTTTDSSFANPNTRPPETPRSSSSSEKVHSSGNIQPDLKARILASVEERSDETELDDPTQEYVRLQLAYDNLTRHHRSVNQANTHEISLLYDRIKAVKKDYLFDERKAETLYQAERKKIEDAALEERLKGTSSLTLLEPSAPVWEDKPSAAGSVTPEKSLASTNDIFDDDGSSVGLFDMFDDPSQSGATWEGTTIQFKDMGSPKHWSGRTPKRLLQEVAVKKDRFVAISYSIISGASRAKRASVSIRWDGQRTETWSMTDVACGGEMQAEEYIATIALHSLTFSHKDSFTSSSGNGATYFRLLPAVFRELWKELESARKDDANAANRATWAKLRSIIDDKLDVENKMMDKVVKEITPLMERPPSRSFNPKSGSAEKLVEVIRNRQSSPEYQKMLPQRQQLPISQYKQIILDMLETSQVLVLSGETGCGKSTQVPAFILEDQLSQDRPCKIYCTEPRRISAVSLAQRVSRELGEAPNAVGTSSSLVGYSIRLESKTSKTTRLTFVTNGIALRMLEGGSGQGAQGTAFDELTHIIIDEVHERTIESDFLLIVLKSLLAQRSDLKVILMSATVDAEKIATYFDNCPTLNVPGRTFPVDVRYLEDAVEIAKWHITENSPYARRFQDKFSKGKNRPEWSEDLTPADDDDDQLKARGNVKLEKRYSPETTATINLLDERVIPYDLIIRLLEEICFGDAFYAPYSSAVLIFMPGIAEIRRLNETLSEHPSFGNDNDFRIYPLHSTLSSESQSAVFEMPPHGMRKIVIATNIAETGITIPDITCVIDTGKHREMRFDEKRQISRLVETFVARSNATQRRGRAGRVQSGLCFHLFTKMKSDTQMADNPLPEMLRLSLSHLALRIKIMKVKLGSSIEDVLSRALDPPASVNIQRAVSMLVEVRALTPNEDITPMGRLLSKLPTDVHLGKFLLIATLFRCLDPALTIAAALNSKSPFVSPLGLEQEAAQAKNSFKTDNSDFLTIHGAFASWRRASSVSVSFVKQFCRTNYLSHQNLQQIEELRQQFLGYLIDSSFILVDKAFIHDLSRSRYGRYRTRFVSAPSDYDVNSSNTTLLHAALTAGLYPKILLVDFETGQTRTITSNNIVAFHPSSVNHNRRPTELGANYLSYFTLMHSKKLYAWEIGPVDDLSLILLCSECEFKLISNTVYVDRKDRKLRFQVSPKTNLALKVLRSKLTLLLSLQMRSKALTSCQVRWNDLALSVLGGVKEEKKGEGISVVVR
ncbi:hypothetical protein AX17_000792 [Amanita inopinata Kibby_2008]|nr:hypothetical protein AX17_000792 [Amanita inopinata Kibby_2008]